MKVYKDKTFDEVCAGSVSYGFFGRTGGVSTGIYSSLNCGTGSGDDADAVRENRNIIAQKLCGVGGEISTLYQCHTPDCLIIDTPVPTGEERPKADALVTDKPGLPIAILTADCGPVLFAAKKANGAPVVGAAHAGWGGALGGVLEGTIAKMLQIGAVPETIRAVLGPCIMQASYEVQDDFAGPFVARHEKAGHFFRPTQKTGHLMFDMPGYIAMRLALAGVPFLSTVGVDTYAEEENCFSFRRATHRGEKDYGREMSAIVINR